MQPPRTIEDLENILREHKKFERYGIKRLGVFGSFARGEAVFNDIDFYLEEDLPLREIIALRDCIAELLGLHVDMVWHRYADTIVLYRAQKEMKYVRQAA